MENLKRSAKRLLTRLTILGLVVICGAIAIAQAQKDRNPATVPDLSSPTTALTDVTEKGIPLRAVDVPEARPNDWGQQAERRPNGWGQQPERPLSQLAEPRFVKDTTVQAVSSNEEAGGSRFGNSPSDEPATEANVNTVRDRFRAEVTSADQFDSPTGLTPPPLITDSDPLPALPKADPANMTLPEITDTNLALPPEFASQPPTNDFAAPAPSTANEGPDSAHGSNGRFGNDQPSRDHFANGEVVVSDRFPDDRFAKEPPSGGNPMRRDAAATSPATRQPAPIANDPPSFDAPAADRQQTQLSREDFAGEPDYAAELPLPKYEIGERSVSLSGVGKPGPRELEGPQKPSLSIHKIAPTYVRVGEPTTFQVKIRNNGEVPAERVLIRDEVPQGTQLVNTNPQATPTADGAVMWQIGTLRPNEEVTVSMQVTPLEEGQIGSVASVTFQALASARADVKKPMLVITHSSKRQVLVGDTVNFAIQLENPGSGPANDVVIEEVVPEGLSHSQGPKLKYEIGTIPGRGSRRLELSLKAAKAGPVENVIRARGEGGLIAEHRIDLQVIAPELQVKITGPTRRYLERKATFAVAIENAGTAPAKNVELVATLPQGLKFLSTNNNGRYDRATNTIRWSLDRLPARQFGEIKFTAVPTLKGDYSINALATADMGLRDSKDHGMLVDGIAALLFEVADRVDPIEVGGETTYEIRVKNQGTKEASNVQFVALVPAGMKAVAADGPANYRIEGDRILFNSIASLPAKGESSYKVRIKGVQAGDQRFRVQMTSDDTDAPVVKEESTRVYAD